MQIRELRLRQCNKPGCDVAGPGAEGGVEPSQREDGKYRGDDFVKQLAEGSPKAPEAALGRRGGCICGRGHKSILAQNGWTPGIEAAFRSNSRPGNLNEGTVDGLETTQ